MARPANPELRAEILKAATRIVEGCGPDCVTMREVAAEVGYSPTTLYLYFKDKHAILREVMLQGFDALADFCSAAAVGPSQVDRLRQRARAYVTWGILHPSLYQLMLESHVDHKWTKEDAARLGRLARETGAEVSQAVAAGELRPIEDVDGFTTAVRATMHGVTSLTISRRLSVGSAKLSASEIMSAGTRLGDELMGDLLASRLS
jgi:AcrR family transcriptional regulator